ncbi:S8 family peptidase [Streptosporangium sp. NPDC087985]|uniref:S8 family peptidase n=1 Tax=Streptosporangium sp. NPDC087985 TaxID=3366196 RepID=UPI003804B651
MNRWSSRLTGAATAVALTGALTAGTLPGGTAATTGQLHDYLVFYTTGAQNRAIAAIKAGGGTALSTETKLGYVIARGPGPRFIENLSTSDAIAGVSSDREIGSVTAYPGTTATDRAAAPDARGISTPAEEPLAGRQWDMKMIGATTDGSYATAPGNKKVLVGIIDTGIDGKHPDIAPNFNRALSRNFVTDMPKDSKGNTFDGPCEFKNCKDPVDWDDDGHGTHVASTIGSPINGLGIAGVAPNVSLVNLRAGQDSGVFFLKPSLDALTYAADAGINVVNMSYYVDPWLFNCTANPADSKAEQLEQRGVITGMQRALDYARAHGVTLISALGNGMTDLGKPTVDALSPDYPAGSARVRKIDNSCLNVPAESNGVISVSALGRSGRKAYYSDYGTEQTDLSAPGGDEYDGPGKPDVTRTILAAAPEHVLRTRGLIGADGQPTTPSVVRDCHNGTCAYYQYLAGTSMAAPHATGVAAILISRFGTPGKNGLTMPPADVERLLYATATKKSCPTPHTYTYSLAGQKISQTCENGTPRNGFYGQGIVNAARAATVAP